MASHPAWIRVRVPTPSQAQGMQRMREILSEYRLETVCQAARCPNAVECWSARTATFMLLGDLCTRNCRFCDVTTGDPAGVVEIDEPARLAGAVGSLNVRYVVLTSVDRDDLPDGGSSAYAECIRAVARVRGVDAVEALIPDFRGDQASLDRILAEDVTVIGHNLETVRRLTPTLRDPRAGYEQSLEVLRELKRRSDGRRIKSGIMVGLGEAQAEVFTCMADLRRVGVDILTVGQYLQPSETQVPVVRFVPPGEFSAYEEHARSLGFSHVMAGPRVRSSWHASDALGCG
jgi:lipoyl synthase